MIGIMNYGSGNITAIVNCLQKHGVATQVITSNSDFLGVSRIILPGVGAFSSAMNKLNSSGLRNNFEHYVIKHQMPVLGICIGLHMLFNRSEEGGIEGLGFVEGDVKKLSNNDNEFLRLPHIGWNDVNVKKNNRLINLGAPYNNPKFYFLHSYVINPIDYDVVTSETYYGKNFPASIEIGNIFGVQFHPEKSHDFGSTLLRSFSNYSPN
jgi:glutamine amidotransferase